MRLSAAQYRQMAKPPRKRGNKYNARRVTIDGIEFDSEHEGKRWCELCLLQKAGKISDLQRQVPILLEGSKGPLLTRTGRKMRITVDFSYTDLTTGLTIYEDAKGFATRDYEVRRAVAAAQGVEVREI